MTRGCQKKIIHIKETDSTLYEEAYFILRRGVGEGFDQPGKDQLIKEANRIIDEWYGKRSIRLVCKIQRPNL